MSQDQGALTNHVVVVPTGVDQTPIAVRTVRSVWQGGLTARLLVQGRVLRQRIRSDLARATQKDVVAYRTYIEELWHAALGTEPVELDQFALDLWEFRRQLIGESGLRNMPAQHVVVVNGQQFPAEFYWLLRLLDVTATVFVDTAADVGHDGSTLQDISIALASEPSQIHDPPDTTRQIHAVARAFLAEPSLAVVSPRRSGPPPALINYATPDDEIRAIEAYALTNPDACIGLLLPQSDMVRDYRDGLAAGNLGHVEWYLSEPDARPSPIDWRRPGVKVLTWSSALGLRFDTVIFAGLEQLDDNPPFGRLQGAMRALACTARRELIVSYSGEGEPTPLSCLPRALFDDRTTASPPSLYPAMPEDLEGHADDALPAYVVPEAVELAPRAVSPDDTEAARALLKYDRSCPARRRRNRILTASEEIGLAYLMRGDALGLEDELPEQFRAVLKPDDERALAFDALITHNEGLVRSIAANFSAKHLDADDLYQEGVIGLIRAAEKFNATRGTKFSTYATWWIRQAVGRALPDSDYTIRIPVHAYESMRKVLAVRGRLLNADQDASVAAISRECGLPPVKVIHYLQLSLGLVSLDVRLADSDDTTLADFIALPDSDPSSPENAIDRLGTTELIHRALGTLKLRESEVLKLRYGFDTDEPFTLDRIGERLGVTRERIRQIEGKAKSNVAKALTALAAEPPTHNTPAPPHALPVAVEPSLRIRRSQVDLASGQGLLNMFKEGRTRPGITTLVHALVEHSLATHARHIEVRSSPPGEVPWLALMHDGDEGLGPALRTTLMPGAAGPDPQPQLLDTACTALATALRLFDEILVWNVRVSVDLSRCLTLSSAPRTGSWWLADAEGQPPRYVRPTRAGRCQIAVFRGPRHHVRTLDVPARLARVVLPSGLRLRSHVDPRGTVLTTDAESTVGTDPFLSRHPKSQDLGTETVFADGHAAVVNPWVLPHPDFLSADDIRSAGDPRYWADTQGFYLCCDGRYFSHGGWFGLPGMESMPETSLARIAVDIEPDEVSAWGLNGSPSRPHPPAPLRPRLAALADLARERSRQVHRRHTVNPTSIEER